MIKEVQSAYRKGVRWSLIGTAGSAFFQFAQMAVFARLAGPEAAGDYALAATFIGFLSPMAELGLNQAVVQAPQIESRQLATLTWVNWIFGALIYTVLWKGGPVLFDWFERPELPGLLLLMGVSLLFTPFGAPYSGLISRELQFEKIAQIEILAWIISFVCTACLAWMAWGAWSMAAGFLVRNLVITLGSVWVGRQIFPVHLFKTSNFREIKQLLRFSLFDLSSRWADFLSNYLDKLIVAKWLGAAALGYYNLAFTFLMLPTARLGYVVTRVAYPLFAKLRHERAQLQVFFERLSREVMLLLFPVYLAIALFSKEIVWIFLGEKWLPAAPLFVAFGLAGWVRTLSAPFPQLIKGLGKPQFWLVWMLMYSGFLCGGLVLFLYQNPTVESAAWSRTAVKFTFEIGLLWWLSKWCRVDFVPALRFALKVAFYLVPVVVLTWLVDSTKPGLGIGTVLKAMVFGTSLILVYWFGPLQKSVRALARNFGFV